MPFTPYTTIDQWNGKSNSTPSSPKSQAPAQPKSGGLIGDLLGFNVGNNAYAKTSNQGLGGANPLGQLMMPRTAAVAQRQATQGNAKSATPDEAAGIGGEVAQYAGGALGLPGLIAGATIHGATTPGADLATRAKNATIEGGSAAALSGAAKLAGKALPYLSKTGVAGKINQAATDATENGAKLNFNDLANKIRQQVEDKLGNTPEIKGEVEKLLAEKAPAEIDPVRQTLTPSDLVKWRQQISARSGGGGFMQGQSLADKVGAQARNVITSSAKGIAPGLKTADTIYSTYSKMHGSPAEYAGRAAAGVVGGKVLKALGIPETPAVDALMALLSGKII